jgi:translation initiation factor 2-alpha kinase 3
MFRSAAEMSHSDPDSSSEEGFPVNDDNYMATDDAGPSSSHRQLANDPDIDLENLLLEEEEQASLGNSGTLGGALDTDADGHAAVMTAALLEFFCHTRAMDFLNSKSKSLGRFTRESPEVQKLAKRMYQYKSQFLSKHGIIAGGIDTDDWEWVRKQYRDNLDVIGKASVDGMSRISTPTIPESRPPSRGPFGSPQRMSASVTSLVQTSKKGPPSLVRTASHDNAWDLQKRNQHRHSQGFVHFNNLLRSPEHPSEPAAMRNSRPSSVSDRVSRYAFEFLELKLLGRGSFGQVFEAKHHVDGQNYAVKKIPLSKKRLEMLQQEGVHHLEHILKEIRTLARLDHKNVVRYFGAWVEENQVLVETESEAEIRIESIQEDPAEEDQSFGIVFGLSSNGGEDDSKSGSTPKHTALESGSHNHLANDSSQSIAVSNGEEDDDVESVQRNFSLPQHGGFSHDPNSTWDGTDTNIFTRDDSEDVSNMKLSLRDDPQDQTMILHIQMSLHPLTLSKYLSPQNGIRNPNPSLSSPRHCFHILPSLRFFLGILSGVEYLHSKGIVHRDLKPANIFLSSRENDKGACHSCRRNNGHIVNMYRPRIGDFGLVADISHCTEPQFPHATTVQDSPRRFRHVGTEFYCPRKSQLNSTSTQQHARDEDTINEKLDVFALGVILFELTYRLDTRMERQLVLSGLTRGGLQDGVKIPRDFESKVDCGCATLSNGMSVGQSLSQCIQSMLHPDSRARFGCKDVRRSLQQLILMVEESSRW